MEGSPASIRPRRYARGRRLLAYFPVPSTAAMITAKTTRMSPMRKP